MKPGFKKPISWNKYPTKITIQAQKQYLGYLIDPGFQGVNTLFVLSFKDNVVRAAQIGCFLLKGEVKSYDQREKRFWSDSKKMI